MRPNKLAVFMFAAFAAISILTFGKFRPFSALAQASQTQPQAQKFPDSASVRSMGPANIATAEAKLNGLVTQLRHDPNSYDGHRDKAVQLLIQAREELNAAAAVAQTQGN